MHPDGRWCGRHIDQQRRNHAHRSAPRVPHDRHVYLRLDAAPFCGGLHHQPGDGVDGPCHCWTRSSVYRRLQCKSSLSPLFLNTLSIDARLILTRTRIRAWWPRMRGSLAVNCLRNDSVPTRLASQLRSPSSLRGWRHLPRRTLSTLRLSTGDPDTDISGWHLAGSARE